MNQEIKMPSEADKIAHDLQQRILEGYSERFKDEFLNPRNIGKIQNPDSYVRITGVCGDTVEVYLAIKDGRINDIRFMTDGCGATIACASYVTRIAKGKSIEEALRIKPEDVDNYFGGLPEENKHCAELSVRVLKAALSTYESKKQSPKFSCMKRQKKAGNGKTPII